MNDILNWLSGGDLRSDGASDQAAEFALQNSHLFDELYDGLYEVNDVIRGRAADAMEKVARSRPDLLIAHLAELIEILESDRVAMVKMHLAMILGHLAHYGEHKEVSTRALLNVLSERGVFARSWAIVSLCILGRLYPELKSEIAEDIARLQYDDSVAIRTKVRYALAVLTDDDLPFPKGWIKSENILATKKFG